MTENMELIAGAQADDDALQRLLPAALAMYERGVEFARRNDPAAYAALQRVTPGSAPQLIVTMVPGRVAVRGLLVNAEDGEAIAQVFEFGGELAERKGRH